MKGARALASRAPFPSPCRHPTLLPPHSTNNIRFVCVCPCYLLSFNFAFKRFAPSQHQKDAKRITHTVKVFPCPSPRPLLYPPLPLLNACGRWRHSTLLAVCVVIFHFAQRSSPHPKFVYVEKSNIPSRTRESSPSSSEAEAAAAAAASAATSLIRQLGQAESVRNY